MKTKLILCILTAVLTAVAQTNVTIDLSAGGYLSSVPHSSGDFSVIVTPAGSSVSSYTTFEVRPISTRIIKGTSQPNINTRTGIQWVAWTSGKLDLALLADGGLANGSTGTSFTAATGGRLSFYPLASAPQFGVNVALQALGASAALGGWNPLLTVGASFTFNGLGSLKSSKAQLKAFGKSKGR